MKRLMSLLLVSVLCSVAGVAQSESFENEVIENIMTRRSIRKYLDKPVDHSKLELVARCGINAPNGMNAQNWEVRVVENYDLIERITDVYRKANPEAVKRDPNFKNMFRNAPNIICVATPENGSADVDAGLMGENMMLAAHSLGLGTCCLGGSVRFLNTSEDAQWFIEKLGFSKGYKLKYIIAIGYPDESPEAKSRDASKVKFIK